MVFFKELSVYLSTFSSLQRWAKSDLKIQGIQKNTKHIPGSIMLNFGLTTI